MTWTPAMEKELRYLIRLDYARQQRKAASCEGEARIFVPGACPGREAPAVNARPCDRLSLPVLPALACRRAPFAEE